MNVNEEKLKDHEVIDQEDRQRLAYYLDKINDETQDEDFNSLNLINRLDLTEEYYSSMFAFILQNEVLRVQIKDLIFDRVQQSSFYKIEERMIAEIKRLKEKKVSA